MLDPSHRYVAELVEEVGEPSPASVARAEDLEGRLRRDSTLAPEAS